VQDVDAELTGAGDRLVGGQDQLAQAVLLVQRGNRHDHRHGRAVGVGDDAARAAAQRFLVDLGDDQRHVLLHPERRRVVHHGHAAGHRDRRPLQRDVVGDVEHRHVHAVEDVRGQLADRQLLAAAAEGPSGRARGGDQPDLAPDVAPRRQQLAHNGADRAGGSDHGERGLLRHQGSHFSGYRPVPA
jgi:hypothetical protein